MNLLFAPADRPRTVRITYNGPPDEQTPVPNLDALTQPGLGRWQPLTTVGVRGPDHGPLAVDTLTIPYDNYRWSGDYGSKRWSARDPNQLGPDVVPVTSATLSADGKTVQVRLAEVKPVMQMQIGYQLRSASGTPLVGTVDNTIHRVAP